MRSEIEKIIELKEKEAAALDAIADAWECVASSQRFTKAGTVPRRGEFFEGVRSKAPEFGGYSDAGTLEILPELYNMQKLDKSTRDGVEWYAKIQKRVFIHENYGEKAPDGAECVEVPGLYPYYELNTPELQRAAMLKSARVARDAATERRNTAQALRAILPDFIDAAQKVHDMLEDAGKKYTPNNAHAVRFALSDIMAHFNYYV